MNTCPYVCNNKTEFGYCCSTACINPMYNRITVNQWLEKADYVQVVRCKDCRHWQGKSENDATEECDGVMGNIRTTPDFYCAYGERKDETDK